jgi:sulfate permease, SulP family
VYRYDAPLFFANAQDFRRRALAAARCHGAPRWFVLNVEANAEVDFTALEAVEALRDELARDGTVFAVTRVKQDLLVRLEAFGLVAKIGQNGCSPPCPPRSPPSSSGSPPRTGTPARNRAETPDAA